MRLLTRRFLLLDVANHVLSVPNYRSRLGHPLLDRGDVGAFRREIFWVQMWWTLRWASWTCSLLILLLLLRGEVDTSTCWLSLLTVRDRLVISHSGVNRRFRPREPWSVWGKPPVVVWLLLESFRLLTYTCLSWNCVKVCNLRSLWSSHHLSVISHLIPKLSWNRALNWLLVILVLVSLSIGSLSRVIKLILQHLNVAMNDLKIAHERIHSSLVN